jgi:hypothetical protein
MTERGAVAPLVIVAAIVHESPRVGEALKPGVGGVVRVFGVFLRGGGGLGC